MFKTICKLFVLYLRLAFLTCKKRYEFYKGNLRRKLLEHKIKRLSRKINTKKERLEQLFGGEKELQEFLEERIESNKRVLDYLNN